MSWSIIFITAEGSSRTIMPDLQSEARALSFAREASLKDPDGIYEVRQDGVTRLRLRGGTPISEPKLP